MDAPEVERQVQDRESAGERQQGVARHWGSLYGLVFSGPNLEPDLWEEPRKH